MPAVAIDADVYEMTIVDGMSARIYALPHTKDGALCTVDYERHTAVTYAAFVPNITTEPLELK